MLAVVATLFAVALAAPFLCRGLGRRAVWPLAAFPLAATVYFARLAGPVAAGERLGARFGAIDELGLALTFSLDGLALLFALLVCGIGTLVVLYAGGYLAPAKQGRFYGALFAFMASMLGLVLADNLLALFIFWELTSVTSYLLIGFYPEREEVRKAALQALLVTALGGLALLAGFLLLARAGGSFELSQLTAGSLADHPLYGWILVLILLGAFTKSAQVPFHFWLPNAMAAPAPASAYLHSSTMVKAGIYLLARLHPTLGGTDAWFWTLVTAGGVTMLLGAGLGLGQTDLKRTLAFGTVSALGSLTFFLGVGTPAALEAAMVFLLAHALYKGALFLVVGAVDHAAGSRDPRRLGGLAGALPVLAGAGLAAALSMGGFPPSFGFLSKETVLEAAVAAPRGGMLVTAGAVAAGAMIVTLGLLAGVKPFFGRRPEGPAPVIHRPPALMLLGPVVLAGLGLALGLVPGVVGRLLIGPAAGAAAGEAMTVKLALWHGVTPALVLGLTMLAAGSLLYAGWGRLQEALARLGRTPERAADTAYDATLAGLFRLAGAQTRLLQEAPLSRHLLVVIAVVAALVGGSLVAGVGWPAPEATAPLAPVGVGLALALLAGAGVALAARSRLAAVAALGVVGFAVALVFLYFGAPDLALTQLVIETLTVVLVVLAFRHLPRLRRLSSPGRRLRDALVALAAGAVMTGLVLLALQVQLAERISGYFAQASVPQAHGRNVVNVILVDFRALDTLGEITVLAVAGLGVLALLGLGRGARAPAAQSPKSARRPPAGATRDGQRGPAPGGGTPEEAGP